MVKAQDSLERGEDGFCHGLELTDSAGGGWDGPFEQEGQGIAPIVMLAKFAQFLLEKVDALERLIDFQALLELPGRSPFKSKVPVMQQQPSQACNDFLGRTVLRFPSQCARQIDRDVRSSDFMT